MMKFLTFRLVVELPDGVFVEDFTHKTLNPSFNGGMLLVLDTEIKIHVNKTYYNVLNEAIAMLPIVIYFKQNSYLVEPFSEKLDILTSSGLIHHWLNPKTVTNRGIKSGPKQITLKTLFGVFMLALCGNTVALLVFWSRWQ